jgi:hypothetical protein
VCWCLSVFALFVSASLYLLARRPIRSLSDGFPILQPHRSVSSACIPDRNEHGGCERQLSDFPYLPSLESHVLGYDNAAWNTVKPQGQVLKYSTESDIVHTVRNYVESVVSALGLGLELSGELSIQHIRPDLSVILNDNYLVGVIEVKKPTAGVLEKPTVLGELFDQMMLVEGFYGMGPAIGILTTGEEWIFSWFPSDHATLLNQNATVDSFTTPTKQKLSNPESKTHSPSGNTPSQKSGHVHPIEREEDESTVEVDPPITSPVDRLLFTTPVMTIHSDPTYVLKHLCGALLIMSTSISRCLLRFHTHR